MLSGKLLSTFLSNLLHSTPKHNVQILLYYFQLNIMSCFIELNSKRGEDEIKLGDCLLPFGLVFARYSVLPSANEVRKG